MDGTKLQIASSKLLLLLLPAGMYMPTKIYKNSGKQGQCACFCKEGARRRRHLLSAIEQGISTKWSLADLVPAARDGGVSIVRSSRPVVSSGAGRGLLQISDLEGALSNDEPWSVSPSPSLSLCIPPSRSRSLLSHSLSLSHTLSLTLSLLPPSRPRIVVSLLPAVVLCLRCYLCSLVMCLSHMCLSFMCLSFECFSSCVRFSEVVFGLCFGVIIPVLQGG